MSALRIARPANRLALKPYILAAEVHRPQLPPLTTPHAQEHHQSSTGDLQGPPKVICRYRAGVQGCDYKVYEVDGDGKVQNELRPCDEKEYEDDAGSQS